MPDPNNQSKSPKESPFYESMRPHWRDTRRHERPGTEPRILPTQPRGRFLFPAVVKKLWFPILLLPMTLLVILRLNEQKLEQYLPSSLPIPSISRPTPTQDSTANWRTFRDNRFRYVFKYPPNWSYDVLSDGPLVIKNEKKEQVISVSSFNPSLVGISYCEGEPQDERCETLETESGIFVTIDWEFNGRVNAILDGTSVTLEKVTRDTKPIFRQILSAFQFTGGFPAEENLPPTIAGPTPSESTLKDNCIIGGCSGEICADQEMFSTCVLRPEAACYKSATCERQANGTCGWTQTPKLTSCLQQNQSQ